MLVDRLEELLALLEREDDEEEQEDAWTLTAGRLVPAAPALKPEDEEETDNGAAERTASPQGEEERLLAETEELDWARRAEVFRAEQPDETERQEEAERPDETERAPVEAERSAPDAEAALEELRREGMMIPAVGQGGFQGLNGPEGRAVEPPEETDSKKAAGTAEELDAALESRTAGERGLETLYRQAAQAARPAAQTLPVEQAGRSRPAEEPGRTATLTVDELDRAVRRDSRRYDGGMTIF